MDTIKDMSRAEREFKFSSLKKKRSKYHLGCSKEGPVIAGKLARTPANCSCDMCGNPRKWFNQRTIQEKKHLDILREEA